jgi:hypothetical protein
MFDLHVLRSKTLFAIIVLTFAVSSLTLRAATPTAPSNLTATVNGLNVTLSWTASANSPTFYRLQAGLAPGQTFVHADVSPQPTSITASAGPGTYYVRAIAFNNEGGSAPSNEVEFTLTCAPTSPPLNFRAMMRGAEAYLFWRRPAGGPTTHYTVQAGLSPGDTIIGASTPFTTINAAANSGTYYARVAAVNACGTSPVSNEIEVAFPSASGRVADPEPGTLLGLPDIQQLLVRIHNENPGLLAQSCPHPESKYENNPWLDRMIDRLREYDRRFGYNKKPTRGPADNGGQPVIAAGDEITYFAGSGPAEGSRDVFVIDILSAHCSTEPSNPPTPSYRDFTGQEEAIWTSLGRFPDN